MRMHQTCRIRHNERHSACGAPQGGQQTDQDERYYHDAGGTHGRETFGNHGGERMPGKTPMS